MRKRRRNKNIRVRIQEAEAKKDWGGLSHILDEASEDEVRLLDPVIPELLVHPAWIVRASALDLVGTFRLRKFLNLVKAHLEDSVINVRDYALTAYYDLLGADSLPVIEKFCGARDIGLRVTALVIYYVETRNKDVLNTLTKIITRKNCNNIHRYIALNTFKCYLDIRHHPEIMHFFQAVLENLPRTGSFYKDLIDEINEWNTSGPGVSEPERDR